MSNFEVDIRFNLAIATRHDQDTGVFVGYCPALNIYSQGRSADEADQAVMSAVSMFVGVCYGRGILHGFLNEKGFTKMSPKTEVATGEPQYISLNGFDRVVERSIPMQMLGSAGRVHDVPCSTSTH